MGIFEKEINFINMLTKSRLFQKLVVLKQEQKVLSRLFANINRHQLLYPDSKKKIRQEKPRDHLMHYSYNHKLEKVKVVMNTKHKLAGFMTLNKAYTDNMLTNNYLTQIKEHIDWLEYDNNIKWMTIRSKDMEVFSKGFDVTTMLYNIRYGNKENVIEY